MEKQIPEYEKLGISNDFMFGHIMLDADICKRFLEVLLDIRIDHIEYVEPQKVLDPKVDARSVRFDIYVDGGKVVYNCEMQTTNNRNLPKRTRYYQGMIDINLIHKGDDYDDLKKSFVIFICTFDPFKQGSYVYTFRNVCKEFPDLELGDETVKVFFNTKGTKGNISSELKEVLKYIQTSEISEKTESSLVRDMDDALQKARTNKDWRHDFMTLEMKYREMRKEGREEGLQEGLQEGRRKESERYSKLIRFMIKNNEVINLEKVAEDPAFREEMFKKYSL